MPSVLPSPDGLRALLLLLHGAQRSPVSTLQLSRAAGVPLVHHLAQLAPRALPQHAAAGGTLLRGSTAGAAGLVDALIAHVGRCVLLLSLAARDVQELGFAASGSGLGAVGCVKAVAAVGVAATKLKKASLSRLAQLQSAPESSALPPPLPTTNLRDMLKKATRRVPTRL